MSHEVGNREKTSMAPGKAHLAWNDTKNNESLFYPPKLRWRPGDELKTDVNTPSKISSLYKMIDTS